MITKGFNSVLFGEALDSLYRAGIEKQVISFHDDRFKDGISSIVAKKPRRNASRIENERKKCG